MTEELERLISDGRPVPDARWRGALGRRVGASWTPVTRPNGLGARIVALAAAGTGLIVTALTQI